MACSSPRGCDPKPVLIDIRCQFKAGTLHAILFEAYRHLGTDGRQHSAVDLLEICVVEFDGRRKAKRIHVAIENRWIGPFRFGHSAITGTELDRQRLEGARSLPAL